MKLPKKKTVLFMILGCALFILDRITKLVFIGGKNDHDFGFFAFTFAQNTGASFSILKDMNLLLIVISLLVFGLLLYYRKEIPKISFALILAGLFGNLFDRILYGFVVDFANFKFFPIFNVADSCISIGIVVWIILLIVQRKKPKH
jgi:signal peptidase II